MIIRDAHKKDFVEILQLNTIEEKATSPLTVDDLIKLDEMAKYHKVADVNGVVAGFLFAIDQGKPYQSENYKWFNQKYKQFLYVDRIVVGKAYAGLKIGTKLYEDLFSYALENRFPIITCEYNIVPLNEASQLFHNKFGFAEVSQQWLNIGEKCVSLQLAEIGK